MREWKATGTSAADFWLTRDKAGATIGANSENGKTPADQWRVVRVTVIDRSFPETSAVKIEGTILHSFDGDADEAADVLAEALLRGARACREAMRAPLVEPCDGCVLGACAKCAETDAASQALDRR